MKMIKMALLGGAALAVTTAAASADDLADLKAQVEALNARVATMEAAPSIPAGYSLLTISEGDAVSVPGLGESAQDRALFGNKATHIGIMPTADAPAATEIVWSGYVRAGVLYHTNGVQVQDKPNLPDLSSKDTLDVMTRGQLKVVGKTDTAVGEVGALVQLRANYDESGIRDSKPYFRSNEYWGWWAITPELTLGGGYSGSLANIGYGYDGACNCYLTDYADVAMNPGDASQVRLSYASGPFTAAVAIEDDTKDYIDHDWYQSVAAAGEIKYSGDMFSGEIAGYVGDDGRWRAGAGLGFSLDPISLSMGAQIGDKRQASIGANGVNHPQNQFWTASILASANLSDEVHAEIAYGHTDYTDANYTVDGVLGGIYYDPVSQLTVGLEGEWINDESHPADEFLASFVSVFRF